MSQDGTTTIPLELAHILGFMTILKLFFLEKDHRLYNRGKYL